MPDNPVSAKLNREQITMDRDLAEREWRPQCDGAFLEGEKKPTKAQREKAETRHAQAQEAFRANPVGYFRDATGYSYVDLAHLLKTTKHLVKQMIKDPTRVTPGDIQKLEIRILERCKATNGKQPMVSFK